MLCGFFWYRKPRRFSSRAEDTFLTWTSNRVINGCVCTSGYSGLLGPLHISLVNLSGTDSEILPHLPFLCKNISVFIWEVGLAKISVFATKILVTGMKSFPHEHSSPVTGMKHFRQNSFVLTTLEPKWQNFDLVCISTLGVRELALIRKASTKLHVWQSRTMQVYVPPFWFCFLNSSRSTGLRFPMWTHHRIQHGNRATQVTGLMWRGP